MVKKAWCINTVEYYSVVKNRDVACLQQHRMPKWDADFLCKESEARKTFPIVKGTLYTLENKTPVCFKGFNMRLKAHA